MTIDSDGDDQPQEHTREKDEAKFDPQFIFDFTGDPYVDVIDQQNVLPGVVQGGLKPVCAKFYTDDQRSSFTAASEPTFSQ